MIANILAGITSFIIRHKLFCSETLTRFVLQHYPWRVTTQVDKYKTVLVKKGKIREWRTYAESGKRVQLLKDVPQDKIIKL